MNEGKHESVTDGLKGTQKSRSRHKRVGSVCGAQHLSNLQRFHNKRQSWPLSEATAELHLGLGVNLLDPAQVKERTGSTGVNSNDGIISAGNSAQKERRKNKKFNYHKMAAVPSKRKNHLKFNVESVAEKSVAPPPIPAKRCPPIPAKKSHQKKMVAADPPIINFCGDKSTVGPNNENVEAENLLPVKDRIKHLKSTASTKEKVNHLLPKAPITGCLISQKKNDPPSNDSSKSPCKEAEEKLIDESFVPSLHDRINNYSHNLESDFAFDKSSFPDRIMVSVQCADPDDDPDQTHEESLPSIKKRIGNYKESLATDSAPIPPSSERIAKETSILVNVTEDVKPEEEECIPSIKDRIGNYKSNLAADSAPIPPSSQRIAKSKGKLLTSETDCNENNKVMSLKQRIGSYQQNLASDSAPIPPSSAKIANQSPKQVLSSVSNDSSPVKGEVENQSIEHIPSIKDRIGNYKQNLASDSAPLPPSSERLAKLSICEEENLNVAGGKEEFDAVPLPSIKDRIGCYKQSLAEDSAEIPPSSDRITTGSLFELNPNSAQEESNEGNHFTESNHISSVKERKRSYKRNLASDSAPPPPSSERLQNEVEQPISTEVSFPQEKTLKDDLVSIISSLDDSISPTPTLEVEDDEDEGVVIEDVPSFKDRVGNFQHLSSDMGYDVVKHTNKRHARVFDVMS